MNGPSPPGRGPSGTRAGARRQALRSAAVAVAFVVLLVVAGSFVVENDVIPTVTVKSVTPIQTFLNHIKHVVVVVMENHAFDTMYGSYCPTKGPYCPMSVAGIPPGTCVQSDPNNASHGCIRPYAFSEHNDTLFYALPHDHNSSIASYNNGSMDGFYWAEHSQLAPFGYYDANTTPLMWDFAEEYGLADNYFGGTLSYSLPTHWSYVSGGNGPAIAENFSLANPPGVNETAGSRVRSIYLQEAQNVTSVEDLLARSSTSWDYYEFALGNWSTASNVSLIGGASLPNAFNYWNPQAAKEESYGPNLTTHFVPNQDFFANAANGTLPSLSWVIPYFNFSEHPPTNVTFGDEWLSGIIDSVEASPDWNTTALFVTYDEYGGFWDNVPPPTVDGIQLGFRLPLVVISPYTPAGLVVPSLIDPWSILALFEAEGGLGCMSALDCDAPSALGLFNFSMPPRPPMLFPNYDVDAAYPMAPQPWNATWAPVPWQVPPAILAGEGESSGFVD
jgi:phospholipase C